MVKIYFQGEDQGKPCGKVKETDFCCDVMGTMEGEMQCESGEQSMVISETSFVE